MLCVVCAAIATPYPGESYIIKFFFFLSTLLCFKWTNYFSVRNIPHKLALLIEIFVLFILAFESLKTFFFLYQITLLCYNLVTFSLCALQ